MNNYATIEILPIIEQSRDGTSVYSDPGAATCGKCGKRFRFGTWARTVCPHCKAVYESFEFGSQVLQEAQE